MQIVAHALFDRRNELPRYDAAGDLVDELEARTARLRFDLNHDIAELTVTARLFFVPPALLGGFADRLAIADMRHARRQLQAELPFGARQRRLQMNLALPSQNGFVHLGHLLEEDAGIFLAQLRNRT